MAQPNPKLYQTDQVHYLIFRVAYNSTGIASGVRVGTIPSGSYIIGTDGHVATVFNAATTNVVLVGTNATSPNNNIIAAADLDETATGLTQNVKPTGVALGPLTADTDVFATYTQTGTAATTGSATIIVKYVPATNVVIL